LKRLADICSKFYLGLIFLFLYAPIGVLVALSFNESRSRAHWSGFSLRWYAELFKDPEIMKALYYTLLVAALSAFLASVIGTLGAIGIDRMTKTQKKIAMNITNIPVMNPDIVTGVSMMILFVFAFSLFNAGSLGFGTLLLSHVTFNAPYAALAVLPKLRSLDSRMYEAALDLGATPRSAFFKVIFPEIAPGIISGALLSFTLSVDDFVISFFTTGAGVNTLSILIYSMARRGINPKINALSAIMFLVVIVMLYIVDKRQRPKTEKL
jgi:spermidine/putrescine transport system permease protein